MNIITWLKNSVSVFFDVSGYSLVAHILILFFVLLTILFFAQYLVKNNILKKRIYKFKDDIDSQIELKREEIKNGLMEDNSKLNSFFMKIDELTIKSGLKRKIPELTAGLFLVFILTFLLFFFMVLSTILNNPFIGIVFTFVMGVFIITVITILAEQNTKKTEKDLKTFMGLLKNFSAGTDDLNLLFSKVATQMEGNIKKSLEEFVQESTFGKSNNAAFENLKKKVAHPQFSKIINNLRHASKNEANYGRIIDLNAKTLNLYLLVEEKKRAIKQSSRSELLFVFVAGHVMLFLVNKMGMSVNIGGDIIGQILYGASNGFLIYQIIKTLKN